MGNLDDMELTHKVNEILINLNLYKQKNSKVGTVLNKFISGGQRKR